MLKNLVILTLVLSLSSCAKQTIGKFIDEVKENRSAVAMTIPSWLINGGMNLALKGVEEDDERAILELGKKIKKLRFVADSKTHIQQERIKEVIADMQTKDAYEPYTMVKHKGSDVYVMVREKENVIENLAILVYAEDNTVVVHMKTKLTMDDLEKSSFTWNKKEKEEIQ